MRARALICAVVLVGACDEASAPAPAPADPKVGAPDTVSDTRGERPKPSAGTPLEDPEPPALLVEVGGPGLPATQGPGGPTLVTWSFKKGRAFNYAYAQKMDMKFGIPELDGQAHVDDAVGTLRVVARDETTADVYLDLDPVRSSGAVASAIAAREPVVYTELVRHDGSLAGSPDPLVGSMLSPPTTALSVGEASTEAVALPVNVQGSALKARGERTLTHRGFVRCGESVCAHFGYRLWVPGLDIPEGIEARAEYQALVRGFSLFDVDSGALYWHRSATRMHLISLAAASDEPDQSMGATMRQQHLHDVRYVPD